MLSNIPAICNTYNIGCYPCAYVSAGNLQATTNELNALIAVGNLQYPTTRGLLVGSEAILQGYNPNTLISNMNYVRAATHTNVPVGTREIPSNLLNNPAVVANADFVMADIYAYWAQVPLPNAAAWTIQQWQNLTNAFPGKRVGIGEANWPTGGTNVFWANSTIVPSVANQYKFQTDFVAMANSNNIEYFIFEFRDEPWKVQENVGTVEANWGILDTNSQKKLSLISYLSSDFSVNAIYTSTNQVQLSIRSYESNPYAILSSTNLQGSPWSTNLNFLAAAGTNRTVVSVTNSVGRTSEFYRARQSF